MYRKCCVPMCNSLRQDVKFHQFPNNKEMKQRWLLCISSENLVMGETRNLYMCHKHFEQKFVKATNRLKMGAYPTLFSDVEISSGKPVSVSEVTGACRDHSYSRKRHYDHTYALPYEQSPNKIVRTEVAESFVMSSIQEPFASSSTSQHIIPDTQVLPTNDQLVTGATPTTSSRVASGTVCRTDRTPRKLVKRRLVKNVKTLTPRCQFLYNEYKKVRHQKDYNARVKRALFFKNKSFEEITNKMNPWSRKVLEMQMKLCMKKKMARRFTTEEKLIALSIYKQGPKSYRFLQKIFILPSETTLKNMVSQLNIDVGINPQIMDLIKNQIKT